MDRFAELRAFVAVIDAGGFSAAARAQGQSRSAVNRLVIALEERLGSQLLNRTTRSVSPTSTGRAFYERARQVLEDLDEMEAAVHATRAEPTGKLRISAPPAFGDLDFSQIVTAFLRQHPRLEVEVLYEGRVIDPVAEGYDLAIRIAQPDEETTLVDHRMLALDYLVCASPAYLERSGVPSEPSDLQHHDLLHLHQSGQPLNWQLMNVDETISIAVRPRMISNSMEALHTAVCGGIGIAVMPEYAVRSDFASGRLKRVLERYWLPPRMLQVVYPPARHLSAKVSLFTEFVRTWCEGG